MSTKLNRAILLALIADATEADCAIHLNVTSTGAILEVEKFTVVAGTTAMSRHTKITHWLDRNDENVDHVITKALRSLP